MVTLYLYFISFLFFNPFIEQECTITDFGKWSMERDKTPLDSTSLELTVSFDKDTVRLEEDLGILVTFTNKTDSSILFYPKIYYVMSIWVEEIFFGDLPHIWINRIPDVTESVLISPGDKYQKRMYVNIDNRNFVGTKYYNVKYICSIVNKARRKKCYIARMYFISNRQKLTVLE